MSKKVYETFALVKEIEVTAEEYEVSFQPVQKYSLDQHFLCLEKEKQGSENDSPSFTPPSEWVNKKFAYKSFKVLKCKVDYNQQIKKIDLLQVAAMKGLPVQIQFEDKFFKLKRVRVKF